MKAVGLDTSVVIRLLTGTPAEQARTALAYLHQCFEDGIKVVVSDMVVVEAYHALIFHYGVPRREARDQLVSFLRSVLVMPAGHSLDVFTEWNGKSPGFVDRMIRRDYLDTVSEVTTFDIKFSKMKDVQLLKNR